MVQSYTFLLTQFKHVLFLGKVFPMPLPEASLAPDFTLKQSIDGKLVDVALSGHHGLANVVLLFYPGAFTGVCKREMCQITEELPDYENLDTVVYGISPDSPYVLAEWARKFDIKVSLLSDFSRTVTHLYEVVWPNFNGLGEGTARAAFVIDKQGFIRYSEETPTLQDLPDFDAVQQCLRGLG